ncbi:ImmA/IrrE family metallo-endopeptidase [Acidobacteriia bacterium AH_259_A11_L15]|nr:ImmA/IrrE family metallo-endopeptidase [Acidobacteriia bacterium AH_259_A11_L15]
MRKRRNKENRYLKRLARVFGEVDPVRAVRLLVGLYLVPGETLESIARRLGIEQIVEEDLPFEGGIFESDAGLIIKLNSLSPYVRRRFTLAHEVAHLLLSGTFGPLPQEKGLCTEDEDLERACDALAAELLMPTKDTVSYVSRLGRASTENLRTVARRFGVSLQVAARRVLQDMTIWKEPFGLWRWDRGPREVWFVGKRPWSTKRPSFRAFDLARESSRPIQTREFYSNGEFAEAISLEVLNLGSSNRLLGMVV